MTAKVPGARGTGELERCPCCTLRLGGESLLYWINCVLRLCMEKEASIVGLMENPITYTSTFPSSPS